MNTIAFQVGESPATLMPVIDGVSLLDRVRTFEFEQDFDVPGQYGPLWLRDVAYGDPQLYWEGQIDRDFGAIGRNYVLACDCGVTECWPLACRIRVEGEMVIWDEFSHPQRRDRDYSGFGPFVFDLTQYRSAVNKLPV